MRRPPLLLAILLVAACTTLDIEALPTAITLSVNRTSAPVGQPFEFTYEATGTFLAGVILDYGDGAVDTIRAPGAQRMSGRPQHSFSAAGSFVVTATAVEASDSTASDTETVEVTGG